MRIEIVGIFFLSVTLWSCNRQDDFNYNCTEPDLSRINQAQLDKDMAIIDSIMTARELDFEVHPSGIRYHIVNEGEGNAVEEICQQVVVHYKGSLLNEPSVVFDESRRRSNDPVIFPLINLILGWQVGIPLIKGGGRIILYLPSGFAYGTSGSGEAIPPNSNLIFDIELYDVF